MCVRFVALSDLLRFPNCRIILACLLPDFSPYSFEIFAVSRLEAPFQANPALHCALSYSQLPLFFFQPHKMAWQAYVDQQLIGKGHSEAACILSKADGSVWAQSFRFGVSK